jgi:hypothetical protein
LLLLAVQGKSLYSGHNSQLESAQKTARPGPNWENFWIHCGNRRQFAN